MIGYCSDCGRSIEAGDFVKVERKGFQSGHPLEFKRAHLDCSDPAMKKPRPRAKRIIVPAMILPSRQAIRHELFASRYLQLRNTDFEGGRPSKRALRGMAREYAHREFRRGAAEAKRKPAL